MRPESIEAAHRRKKRAAALGVAVYGLIMLGSAAVMAGLCFIPDMPLAAQVVLGICAAGFVLLFLPALWVLRARFKEIEGGESDAAAQY